MDSIAEVYDKYAGQYANYLEERLPQFQLAKFVKLLPKHARVLDAACAAGRDSEYLAEEKMEVVGIDISPELVKQAEERVSVAKFSVMDVRKMSFDDGHFDGIWCFGLLNHISHREISSVLAELKRVLADDGVLFIEVISGEGEAEEERSELGNEKLFYSYYGRVDLEQMLIKAGFEIVDSSVEALEEDSINIIARKKIN